MPDCDAGRDMSLDEITITLSDKDGRLSVDTLIKALENALEMLRGVEATIIASGLDVRWEVVRVRMQSPLRMTFAPDVRRVRDGQRKGRPNKTIGKQLVRTASQGLAGIEAGTSLPRGFTDSAIDATRKLLKTAANEGAVVAFESPFAHKTKLTEKAVEHIEEISAKARLYVDYSTIEGRLEVVSVHEHNSFFVWETLTNNRIECLVSDDHMKDAPNLLGKRVAITGRVSYRNHIPKTIAVEGQIRVLRSAAELPQPSDIGPIDITESLSSEDHVRRLRNA